MSLQPTGGFRPTPEEGSQLREEEEDQRALVPEITEDTDGRRLFDAASKYSPAFRKEQRLEGVYLGALLAVDVIGIAVVAIGGLGWILPSAAAPVAERFSLLALGGLLGGLTYGGKWLYHSIAKGLWHQDRRMWRVLSPWISVGTTIGIWALISTGFFPSLGDTAGPFGQVGIGFVIGYLADRFLAKMKELTQVLFGQTEQHYRHKPTEPTEEP